MKKNVIFFKVAILISIVINLTFYPIISYAKDDENEVDFRDKNTQKEVWDVFSATTWTNGLHLNFLLGSKGVAFSANVDNYADFVNVFETPLGIILQEFDKEEAEGQIVTNGKHMYKYVEYQKIVSSVLYAMLVRDGYGVKGHWFQFEYENSENSGVLVNLLDITKISLNSLSQDQQRYFDKAINFSNDKAFEEYALKYLGYTKNNVDKALWGELGRAYFGVKCEDFEEFVKEILTQITRYDDMKIDVGFDGEVRYYYFDVYNAQDMFNYVVLDGIIDKGVKGKSLFEEFVKNGYYTNMKNEYYKSFINDSTEANKWATYVDFRTSYIHLHKEEINYLNYNQKFMSNANYDNKQHLNAPFRYSYDRDEIKNKLPGGEGSGNSFGQFYFKEYSASKIVGHLINGLNGNLIDK